MSEMNGMPSVSIGIMSGKAIRFELKGIFRSPQQDLSLTGKITADLVDGTLFLDDGIKKTRAESGLLLLPENHQKDDFRAYDVTIGIGFHWEKKEFQVFRGGLKLITGSSDITLINILPVEDYLVSVISSEMNANSSPEMLKAHAVISRSWLLAQIEKGKEMKVREHQYQSSFKSEDEIVKWYDREDHADYDVCADDHCQRYQGITRASTPEVERAVKQTSGEVLVFEGRLCDTRFSKCCGGITERFENVWEPVNHPYLQRVYDNTHGSPESAGDLTLEDNARKWILSSPSAFCNTNDKMILSQVLNDYDQKTHDFFRWAVSYKADDLGELIKSKIGVDFGTILDMIPLERGVSGRLKKLRIIGSKKSMIIGKELEIRKALSTSHLYSSAFVVEKTGEGSSQVFHIYGAGWGHGVGLCQIGAAVMGAKGYSYHDILLHYFRGAELKRMY